MSKDTGGPAFPRPRSADTENFHKPETYHAQDGMELRDYFAAKAMQGMLANNIDALVKALPEKHVAEVAYNIADLMLKERTK